MNETEAHLVRLVYALAHMVKDITPSYLSTSDETMKLIQEIERAYDDRILEPVWKGNYGRELAREGE